MLWYGGLLLYDSSEIVNGGERRRLKGLRKANYRFRSKRTVLNIIGTISCVVLKTSILTIHMDVINRVAVIGLLFAIICHGADLCSQSEPLRRLADILLVLLNATTAVLITTCIILIGG
jgi:hypothetical protein